MGIEILAPGLLTSLQDEGRFGLQRSGMSPAGAMDQLSLARANILAGNPAGTGALEATYTGPTVKFTRGNIFALSGADMSPTLDGAPIPMEAAVFAPAGSVLKLKNAKSGCRCYIAFHGGLDVPPVNGSQSTLLRSGIGGFKGRKLAAGDAIPFKAPAQTLRNLPLRRLAPRPPYPKEVTVRVVLGPQDDRFTPAGINTFLTQPFTVTVQADRMASRLEGPKVEHVTDANMLSDGIPLGAVQVPGSGQPIIMMSEHQGSGGYTKIATVISTDIALVAQCPPGGKIRFAAVTVEQAQAAYLARKAELSRLEQALNAEYQATYHVTVGEQSFAVGIAERPGP